MSPADALEQLELLEEQGWLGVLRYREEAWTPATPAERRAFVDLYPSLKPGWDPDVDYGEVNLHAEITPEGKAEWRRRYPLKRESAWKAETDPNGELTVWAPDEGLADSLAPSFGPDALRAVEPATFELKTGDVVHGVKVTYRNGSAPSGRP